MRWALAGLWFALLVSLAVATAAVRSSNVESRVRARELELRIVMYSIERARGEEWWASARAPAVLKDRWLAWQQMATPE
jgi:hypothetical protein